MVGLFVVVGIPFGGAADLTGSVVLPGFCFLSCVDDPCLVFVGWGLLI
jgi:hypothetical protein